MIWALPPPSLPLQTSKLPKVPLSSPKLCPLLGLSFCRGFCLKSAVPLVLGMCSLGPFLRGRWQIFLSLAPRVCSVVYVCDWYTYPSHKPQMVPS